MAEIRAWLCAIAQNRSISASSMDAGQPVRDQPTRREGPATATALARAFHTHTGATSYHLRKLESAGLVVDDGEGRGRRRLWRATSPSHSWDASDFTGEEAGFGDTSARRVAVHHAAYPRALQQPS